MSIGVAFSGGGIKAAFHIGVLRAFKEEKINIDFVSGTSSGAIIATLYSLGYLPSDMLKIFNYYSRKIIGFDKRSIFKSLININKGTRCINKFDNLEIILQSFFNNNLVFNINELKKKIAICCVDLNLGEIVYFGNCKNVDCNENEKYINDGILYKIIRASCAYPILFEPTCYKGRVLVDGGVMKNLPVGILKKMGAEKVIAIDVSEKKKLLKSLSMFDIGLRSIELMGNTSLNQELKKADLVIKPTNICNINMFDYKYIKMLENDGYYAAKKIIQNM